MTDVLIKIGSQRQTRKRNNDLERHREDMAIYTPKEELYLEQILSSRLSEEIYPPDTLFLDFYYSELCYKKFLLLSHPVYGTVLYQP